ncbi:M48 family metalloprotease [Puia dinghuensis]|uniref:Peptidase M48 domain-containing protein n=1 Tax=Puia dinghuensis TaxID=1792502 RepID=A0A8J2XVA1_9BACT|nr:M48 family metalloprotease [Puia dinghuensis]GGB11186.1 hypothetical protein GCM10011511_38470 [Puia dinghuensis]
MLPEALPYHLKVRDHFKQQQPTWEFFAAARTREEQLVAFQTELLKNTYRFTREADAALYAQIDKAREKLGLDELAVTAYQAQYANDELNASIVYLHQEAHLVFSGAIRERLNEAEMLGVIAHELTHVRLYTMLDGELEVADRIITAIANHPNSEAPYYETARLFKLYTEIYCDRGAYAVLGDTDAVITGLLKIATGLTEVNAANFMSQAESIFTAEPGTQSETPTHPENFIRTRALRLWQEQQDQAEQAITRMIEGRPELDRLDLFSQATLHALTRNLLLEFLQPEQLRSATVLGLAHQYFPDLSWPATTATNTSANPGEGATENIRERLVTALAGAQPSIRDYFSYLLLDFALVDPSLEELLPGRALAFAGEIGLSAVYEPICKKELQLGDKKWQQYKRSHGI